LTTLLKTVGRVSTSRKKRKAAEGEMGTSDAEKAKERQTFAKERSLQL
jgi:hypothetical protein